MAVPMIPPTVFCWHSRNLILIATPLILLICAARIYAGVLSGAPWFNWLAGLVLWPLLFVIALRRRLVFNKDGFDYTESVLTIHVPWTKVSRLGGRKFLGIRPVEGREAGTAAPESRDHFIEPTQFGKSWRQEPLGAILRANAHISSEIFLCQEALPNPSIEPARSAGCWLWRDTSFGLAGRLITRPLGVTGTGEPLVPF